MIKTLSVSACLAAVALFTAGQASATTEIAGPNAGFELGDLTGYTTFGAGSITVESVSPNSGSNNVKLEETSVAAATGLKLNVGAGTVNPFDEVTVSFWARGSAAAGGVHFAELFSEIAPSGTSKSELLGGAPLFPGSDTAWQFYTFDAILGDNVSNGVTLQFVAVTGGDVGSTSTLEVDDISIAVIPEPASVALLGLGGLAMLGRRRRRIA